MRMPRQNETNAKKEPIRQYGCVAMKIVNDRGIESLKILEIT